MSVKVGNVMRGLLVFVSNTQEHGKTVEGRKIEQNLMRFSYTLYTQGNYDWQWREWFMLVQIMLLRYY